MRLNTQIENSKQRSIIDLITSDTGFYSELVTNGM